MDNWDGHQLSVDYWKSHDGKASTKFGYEFGFSHLEVSATYSLWAEEPPDFGLCIPRMKEILSGFDDLPSEVQSFVVNQTHKCNGCRYCVQLDKTGTRPLANIPVRYGMIARFPQALGTAFALEEILCHSSQEDSKTQ